MRRIKRVGEFAWEHCDLGARCHKCDRVTVYDDWEMKEYFEKRRWSLDLEVAVERFMCRRCGSKDIELIAMPIAKRPKPVPDLPDPVHPIYADNYRRLRTRSRIEPTPRDRFREILRLLHDAANDKVHPGQTPDVREALDWLRPHIYRKEFLDELWKGLGYDREDFARAQVIRYAHGHILRQLGIWDEEERAGRDPRISGADPQMAKNLMRSSQ